jgi:hypothetical protein
VQPNGLLRGLNNIRNWRIARLRAELRFERGGEGVGVIAFRPALSRRYRLHQSKRQISQSSGCGVNVSADIDMVDLWRDLAIFSSKLEIELKPCLGPLVLRSPSALSRLQVGYPTGYGEANYYGAVFGH